MIYDGVRLEVAHPVHFDLTREIEPPKRQIEFTSVAGRSGDLVLDGERYTDAILHYIAYLDIDEEKNRTWRLSQLYNDIAKGKKCKLIDGLRDHNYRMSAICTEFTPRRLGIKPTLRAEIAITFQASPFMTKDVLYQYPIGSTVQNLGHAPVPFKASLKVVQKTDHITIKCAKTGERLELVGSFSAGDKIELDMDKQYVSVNEQNAMKMVSAFTDFFECPVGESVIEASDCIGTIFLKEVYLIGG